MQDNRIDLRVFYSKKGPAAYIAHLDTMRTIQRALARADIPLWYTEGFNPHIYMAFPLPLSLGISSSVESFDIKLVHYMPEEEVTKHINSVLPDCIRIIKTQRPKMDTDLIKYARYRIMLSDDDMSPENIETKFADFMNSESILVDKKSKKGMLKVDIKPHIKIEKTELLLEDLKLILLFPAGNTFNLNPSLLLNAFNAYLDKTLDYVDIERINILTEELSDFE